MKAKDCVGIVLVIMLLLPWPVLAAPVGKITNLQGNVDITSPGKAARIAKVGDGVNVGDFIRAKSKSKVEITFNEGNVLRLGENSRVGITRYMAGEKQNSSVINLFRGKIHNIIKSVGADGRYEVHTPVSVCGVRGTRFFNYYLAGESGSIFEEGSGYGYSKSKPEDVKKIGTGQGMFVPDAKSGAQVRIVPDHQMDEMKKATDISGTYDASADSSDVIGDPASGDEVSLFTLSLPSSLVSAYTLQIVIPPLIQPVLSSDMQLSVVAGDISFSRKIDNVTIQGTSLDYGTTFTLSASGAGINSPYDPAGGLIKGVLNTGGVVTSGVFGYMMGLPFPSGSSAKALISSLYVNQDGQVGFLKGLLNVSFSGTTISGTGTAEKSAPVAMSSFTPSTLAPGILAGMGVPETGNLSIYTDHVSLDCGSSCESEVRGIDATFQDASTGQTKSGKIGVWGAYSQNGAYYSYGGITGFTDRPYADYDSTQKASLYSDNLSGTVDTGSREVNISGNFLYLSPLYMGKLFMKHLGYYDSSNIYSSVSAGTIEMVPLAFANELSLSLSGISGMMGSTQSLWTSAYSPTILMIGKYSMPGNYHVVSGGWQSVNYLSGSGSTTNDGGGAYKGFLNSHILLSSVNVLNTDAQALYADSSGNIGIIRGYIPGVVYPSINGFKSEGVLNRIEMETGAGISAGTFVSSAITSHTNFGGSSSNLLAGGASMTLTESQIQGLQINGKRWAIGKVDMSGTYSGDPRGNAVFSYLLGSSSGSEIIAYMEHPDATAWNSVEGGYFRGNIVGASADWMSATTSVIGGTIKGTFDPVNSWNATALGTRIETSTFVDMASTETGRAKLAALNIPSVIVGSVNLSGSGNGWTSLNVSNLGFYASTGGGKPQIWASNNVSGNYSSPPPAGTPTALTGSAAGHLFQANFTIQNWNTGSGHWGAAVTSGTISPGLNGATQFQGVAAGTGATAVSGSVSGTASGAAY
jgi:hypothetical protein